MLQFIGTGKTSNPDLGSLGAFIKSPDGTGLVMFDCGIGVFDRLLRFDVLEGVTDIHVVITHFHPDRLASAKQLVDYMYEIDQCPKVTLYSSEIQTLWSVLREMEFHDRHYNDQRLDGDDMPKIITIPGYRIQIIPKRVSHDPDIPCYGYFINVYTDDDNRTRLAHMYYSGEAATIPQRVIHKLESGDLTALYQDVTTFDYPSNSHLTFRELHTLIPDVPELRAKVWCMNLDKFWTHDVVLSQYGFNTAKVEFAVKE
jgi:phosphoribosyl 1,2-cyclic phosphodiesterase